MRTSDNWDERARKDYRERERERESKLTLPYPPYPIILHIFILLLYPSYPIFQPCPLPTDLA